MKILLLNDYGSATGGAEHQVFALRDGLRARGHDARLFSSSALSVGGEIAADYSCYGVHSRLQPLIMAANPSAYRRLRAVLTEFSPDVVHLTMFFWQLSPLVLPLLRAFPVVHHVQMYNAICPLGTKMLPDGQLCHEPSGLACLRNRCFSPQAWAAVMWQRRLWRKWSSSVNLIVAVSDWVRRRLIAEGTPVDLVVWNGVPPRPQAVPAGPPAVVFAGRLVREKGVDTLLRAFARIVTRVPDAILQIAGDGPERMRIESLIRELGVQRSVSMLGFLPRDEMEKRFHSARVQAVPGTWEEPFGLVTAEAMMRGTPVIATARGAATEMINPGVTGLLVPAGDPEALTAALITSLLDADSARAMGRAAREFALERLTESAMVERFLTIYSDLLSGVKPGLLSRDRND